MSKLLILTAMRSELVQALGLLGEGPKVFAPRPAEVRSYPAALAGWSGMGRSRTESTLRALAAERPSAVFHIGVGGGLREGLRPGDAVLVERSFHGEEELAWDTPPSLRQRLAALPLGSTVTVDAIVSQPAQKRALGESYGADMVEMETFWAARVARELGLPFAAVRVVVDSVDAELPDLSGQLDAVGRPKPLAFVKRLAKSPRTIGKLPDMASAFGAAQRRMTELIGQIAQV